MYRGSRAQLDAGQSSHRALPIPTNLISQSYRTKYVGLYFPISDGSVKLHRRIKIHKVEAPTLALVDQS